jgi:hemoglobin/transferrin/lactoferrin receptor protein
MITGWYIFTKRNALVVLTLLFMTLAHAEEKATSAGLVADAGQLETVTVTATRTERNVDEVPASVSVTSEQDINRTLTGGIGDLIRYEPGISVPRSVTRFGNSGFNIRGIEGNRVLIQIDGIRIPDTFSIGSFSNATRDLVDLDALKRVEIVRGPSSSLYGSDAIGGTVSYFTKDPADYLTGDGLPFHIGLKAGYASADDSLRGGITLAGRLGKVEALVVYSRREGHEQETKGDDNSASRSRYARSLHPARSEFFCFLSLSVLSIKSI